MKDEDQVRELIPKIAQHAPKEAAKLLTLFRPQIITSVLELLNPGALVPITLRKLGADPATASSIFLTTATDVVSMGAFPGLASLLI